MKIDRAIRSTRVVTPDGERPAAVLIGDGKIVDVVAYDAVPNDVPLDDWGSLAILPGLVDTHVHCNEPGRTEWEGFETATKSAIAGGVTTIVDMPLNCSPVTTTVDAFRQKLAATEGKLWCDVGFWGGIVPGNLAEIEPLIAEGVLGFKAFLCHSGIDEFPNANEAELRGAMPKLAAAGVPLLVHCELVNGQEHQADGPTPCSYQTWLDSRPPEFEQRAIALIISLCRQTKCRSHIVHLADAGSLAMIGEAKRAGLPLTVETCPHYLHFAAAELPLNATLFKCAPPIRNSSHRMALWQALKSGELDLVASDHSPCPPAMKNVDSGDLMTAWGGIASLQLGIGVVWENANRRRFGLSEMTRWMASAPAQLAGLSTRKGTIAAKCDADLAVFDSEAIYDVDAKTLFQRHRITPYVGERLRGQVIATYLRGRLIYQNGKMIGQPLGRTILRSTVVE